MPLKLQFLLNEQKIVFLHIIVPGSFPWAFVHYRNKVLANLAARFSEWLFLLLKFDELRSIVFLPIRLIKEAHGENWLRTLAYFVRMKSLYVNNTHYNFSLRRLGAAMGVSAAALAPHLKLLKSKDLIDYHGDNLTFRGWRKLSALFGRNHIGIPVDHKNQLTCLRAQLIRFNLSTQEYRIKKSGVQKCPTLKSISERIHNAYTGLSAHGFGRVLKLSKSQGAALRSEMIKLGLFSYKRRYRVLIASGGPSGEAPSGGVLRTALIQMKRQGIVPSYAFVKDGQIVTQKRMELKYRRA